MNKIAVIGAGKWGQALKRLISKNHDCVITNRNYKDIPNFVSQEEALNSEYLIFAIPSQATRKWLEEHFFNNNQKILIASKGIDRNGNKFLTDIFREFLPLQNISYLSGPSFAKEVMEDKPFALNISSVNPLLCEEFASLFPQDIVKTYTSNDYIGSQICGAYKNVISIASGICVGLNLGENAKASLLSRGLVEMDRVGKSFNCKSETFLGLSGAGDLFLSANSVLSRNFRVGLGLAKGQNIEDILNELGEVAEGIDSSYSISSLAKENNIYTPIANEVVNILQGKNVKQAVKDLLSS